MNEMLSAGIELMLIGMGIVFAFLAMLVVAITTMSSVVQRYFPDVPSSHLPGQHFDDPGVIAAISAAVHQYRKKYPRS
jgi:oxaloacetate decarboxylase (Na+ extruding) subunit gamma